ncbi:uncharacterized protein LOC8275589 [Ricinus communis]|uniref:Uncharacterized protein n=1 Tax=Ricinus communis TaxID=3988 RepID=B9RZK3_RICCO|nr:uncharacterized protein LOC8275589 [Ricinus communis]EEF43036.1 conserved hypothetical protein [Ricinus communis]|eukprot:XP_002519172.1 uncharacterized protein LOC8275589 [Ricinus communis]
MSGSGGVSIARTRGENRFYVSPGMRQKQQQQQQQQQQKPQQQRPLISKSCMVEVEKRGESDQCGSSSSSVSNCSVSGRVGIEGNSTNLDRFLEYTTPVVPAQYLPKTSVRGWRNHETEHQPYFVLGDLWESFKEWSAYGAGVPLLLNGSETVMQYYVPYLSGIQLYIDPARPSPRLRRPGEESDAESSRDSSTDGSSDYGAERGVNGVWGPQTQNNITDANIQSLNRLSLRNKHSRGSSSDEYEISNPPGRLVFEYMEHASPFTREPLADKISALTCNFPGLKTFRSCDLLPSSWISVAWYPIYRIPMGPTLQNLDACFLTFHSLSTPFQSLNTDWLHFNGSSGREVSCADMPVKLPLATFGLASYKFKVSFWNPNGAYECQKVNSLLRAADNWLRLLQVYHPDYMFFASHNSNWR